MKKFIPIAIILLAVFFRFYHWENYCFGFDQVQTLENAEKILHGKLTLIGPKGGPAALFIGPLLYYLTAAFMFFISSPLAVNASALFISFMTGLTLFFLTKRYLNSSQGLITLSLWAFSPFLINQDRIPWASNLSFLSASLVFFPLLYSFENKLRFKDIFFIAIGVFLGYQAHFAGLFLYPLILFATLFLKQKIKLIFASTAGLCLTILPTFLFDLRHQWLNLQGVKSLFFTQVNPQNYLPVIVRFKVNLYITIENLGKIIFFSNSNLLIVFSGAVLFLFACFLLAQKKQKIKVFFTLSWSIIIAILFLVYKDIPPDYYFLVQFPALIYLLTLLFEQILNTSKKRLVALAIFSVYSFFYTKNFSTPKELTIGNQVKAIKYLKSLSQKNPIKKINYDMELVYFPGFQYLLKDFKLDPQGQEIVITYPFVKGHLVTANFFPIGIYFDQRIKQDKNYLTMPNYLISTPKDVFLYEDSYRKTYLSSNQVFIITLNQQNLGLLLVFGPQESNKFLSALSIQKNTQSFLPPPWTNLTIQLEIGYGFVCNYNLFFITPRSEAERPKLLDLLEDIQVVTVGSEVCS
jgi:hypothetical protein